MFRKMYCIVFMSEFRSNVLYLFSWGLSRNKARGKVKDKVIKSCWWLHRTSNRTKIVGNNGERNRTKS